MDKDRQPILTHCFALVICKHRTTGKYLCVKETKNRGWWIAGGLVEPGEDFYSAAIRETNEEAQVVIEIKGILRVEHTLHGHQSARMRVIFFAVSDTNTPKQFSDSHSECAAWLTINEIENLQKIKPGIRGPEIIEWPIFIETGGPIALNNFLVNENHLIISENINQIKCLNRLTHKPDDELSLSKFKKALENEDLIIISELLKSGFNPNYIVNQKNWTALHYSIKIKNEKLLKILLLSDLDFHVLTHKLRNCFHFAMQSSFRILKMLIIAISDLSEEEQIHMINAQDEFGDTPLHVLARDIVKYESTNFSVLNYLSKLGADLNIKNKEGYLPKDYLACDLEHCSINSKLHV